MLSSFDRLVDVIVINTINIYTVQTITNLIGNNNTPSKTYVVGTQKIRLNETVRLKETVLLSTKTC